MSLDINFQFGEFSLQGSSFGADLAVGILSALVGAGLAVAIAIWQYNRQRSLELDDTLHYMLLLLKKVVVELKDDVKNLNDFYQKVENTPDNLPLLTKRTNYDIKRLVERIDQGRCYIAYLKHKRSFEEFKNLYSILDFYNEVIIQVMEQLERALNFDHKRKSRFIQIVEELKTELVIMRADPKLTAEKEFWNKLEFTKNIPDREDVKYWYEKYILPLIEVFQQNNKFFPNHNKWVSHLMEAQTIFKNVKQQNKWVAKDLKEYADKLDAQIQNLENHKSILVTMLGEKDN